MAGNTCAALTIKVVNHQFWLTILTFAVNWFTRVVVVASAPEAARTSVPVDPVLNVVRDLACAEFDQRGNSARPSLWKKGVLQRSLPRYQRRLLPTARVVPPSRGILRPETRKVARVIVLLQELDVRGHVLVDLFELETLSLLVRLRTSITSAAANQSSSRS